MNSRKICISVCAENADELIAQIKRASVVADVIEIRFDCLDKNEFDPRDLEASRKLLDKILYKQNIKKDFLLTFRPKQQGGKRHLSPEERSAFWNGVCESDLVDLEEDVIENHLCRQNQTVICSYHNFKAVPDNLFKIYQRIKNIKAKIDAIKIAVQANDITDTIAVWKLLKQAKTENRQIIPIAMGEAGKWTRILGLAHGALMTYASLDAGQETAPGQVSAQDLIEVYRAKELNEETEIYGILGSNTSVSMSPFMHNEAFKFHRLNAVFVPLQVNDLDEFTRRMVKPETREIELNFRGFSVTIPHKQTIIKHLDFLDETAEKIGAVNTVKIVDGKLHGFNTDAQGFIEPLKNIYGDLKNAKIAVLGAGGAARACVYALKKEAADVTIFARDLLKAKILADDFRVESNELSKNDFSDFDILVNSTPLGMKGKAENETPVFGEQIKDIKLVYDLVYNPFETLLLKEADRVHVPKISGLAMLIAQAIEQQKIWIGKDAPMREMSRAVLQKLQ